MKLFGIRIRFHILSPLIFVMLFVFSGAEETLCMLLALSVHELGHLAAAYALKAKIDEIELMPYGAAIRLYGLWEIHPWKLFLISIAGPAANILFSAFLSLLAHGIPAYSQFLLDAMLSGLLVSFVNLIPALPLDGGRCLCAVLSLKIGRRRAVAVGVFAGRAFSVLLFILFIYTLIQTGTVSLLPLLCAVYIFASGRQEKAESEGAYLRSVLFSNKSDGSPRKANVIVVSKDQTVLSASKLLHPGESALVCVTDTDGKIIRVFSDSELASSLLLNANEPFSSFL